MGSLVAAAYQVKEAELHEESAVGQLVETEDELDQAAFAVEIVDAGDLALVHSSSCDPEIAVTAVKPAKE
jgi:hypothetical protein